jgi:HemK-related putative methylase
MAIYQSAEDSFLLEEEVKKYLKKVKDKSEFRVLDMGSGSGIQALAAIWAGVKRRNIIATDINKEAIAELKNKRLPARKSNLFSNINKEKKFNMIIFNPPYLPEDKYDKQADTTAGKHGNEIIIKFLRKAKPYLAEGGIILLLFSSLSKPDKILAYAKKRGYNSERLAEKSVGMMEKLFVYEFY